MVQSRLSRKSKKTLPLLCLKVIPETKLAPTITTRATFEENKFEVTQKVELPPQAEKGKTSPVKNRNKCVSEINTRKEHGLDLMINLPFQFWHNAFFLGIFLFVLNLLNQFSNVFLTKLDIVFEILYGLLYNKEN